MEKQEKEYKIMAKVLVVFGLGIFVWAIAEWFSNPLGHNFGGFMLLLMLVALPISIGIVIGGAKVVAWLAGWAVSFMIAVTILVLIGTFIPLFKATTNLFVRLGLFITYLFISGIAAGLVAIYSDGFIARIENRVKNLALLY